MHFSKKFYLIFLIAGILCAQASVGQSLNKNQAQKTGAVRTDTSDNHIVFLLLKFYRDSSSQNNNLVLMDKIIKPGTLKTNYRGGDGGLTSFPYLSIVYYKNNLAEDSSRRSYPLRERLQNTKATAEGYKDIEVGSREFFMRFEQGNIDRIKIFEVRFSGRRELIAIDL